MSRSHCEIPEGHRAGRARGWTARPGAEPARVGERPADSLLAIGSVLGRPAGIRRLVHAGQWLSPEPSSHRPMLGRLPG